MSGKYRAVSTNRRSSISVLLVAVLAFTGVVTLSNASNATTPTLTAVSPGSGSAAGGNLITIIGNGLTGATAVTIGGVNVAAFTIVSDTEITATVQTRTGAGRTVGSQEIRVEVGGSSNATGELYYTFRPLLLAVTDDASFDDTLMVQLGDLASRTQGKPLSRSGVSPFTVTGTDSNSGESYTYVTDLDKTDYADESGWQNEGIEAEPTIWSDWSNTMGGKITANTSYNDGTGLRNGLVFLGSDGNCDGPNEVTYGSPPATYDTYCSVFGPEVYSEAFYGAAGQSLSFDWAADAVEDDYEIYAFLVKVDDEVTIPAPEISNHILIAHGSGETQPFVTSSGNIDTSGLYRFRFVNGSYDATGGQALGSNMYIDSILSVGLRNEIVFPVLSDQVGSSGSVTINLTSDSGEEIIVDASGDSGCSITTLHSIPTTSVDITWSSLGSCTISASQGASGAYAAAASVSRGFDVIATATVPTAPTITSVTPGAGSVSIAFLPPSRDGGATISNYEYSLDNGSTWVEISPSRTTSPLTVSGLAVDSVNQVRIRAINSVGPSPASNMISATVEESGAGSSAGSGATTSLSHIQTVPNRPKSNKSRISLFGTLFDTVTEVYVGGKKVEILSKGANQLRIKLPGGLSGFVDVEIRSTLGKLSLPRHFNFGGKTNSNRAELIVGGFEQNSRVLTPRMRAEIERWLAKNSSLKTLTCTGFTSLPRRTTDVALSTNRGITSCNFAKRERPELTPIVKTGIEDPRPGSNIRRVRLVLTP